MSIRLQIVIAIIDLIAFFWIVNMVKRKKIDLRYALSWLSALVIMLVLDVFPQVVFFFADSIGIDTPSNMVFFVGFLIITVLIYTSTVSISHLSYKTKKMAQEIALLRKEMDSLKKQNDSSEND